MWRTHLLQQLQLLRCQNFIDSYLHMGFQFRKFLFLDGGKVQLLLRVGGQQVEPAGSAVLLVQICLATFAIG